MDHPLGVDENGEHGFHSEFAHLSFFNEMMLQYTIWKFWFQFICEYPSFVSHHYIIQKAGVYDGLEVLRKQTLDPVLVARQDLQHEFVVYRLHRQIFSDTGFINTFKSLQIITLLTKGNIPKNLRVFVSLL